MSLHERKRAGTPTVVAIGLVLATLAGCGGGQKHTSAPGSPTSAGAPPLTSAGSSAGRRIPTLVASSRPYWLILDFDLPPLLEAGLSQTLFQEYFNNPQTLVITHYPRARNGIVNLLPRATPVVSFSSYQLMRSALSSGSVPSIYRYVLYDNEAWPATPSNEQLAPFNYAAAAQSLAHQYGLGFIFTPAATLAKLSSRAYAGFSKFGGYLTLGFASQGARVADVFEIQAQQAEGTSTFSSFVSGAVGQARAANPRAPILLGIATTAPHSKVTGQLLLNSYRTTRSLVAGYWLNVTSPASGGAKDASAGVSFLQMLAPSLGYSG